jgi:hypothetical protein
MAIRFKVFAIAAALAAGTSSVAMAQYACPPGYTYYNGVCQPVRAATKAAVLSVRSSAGRSAPPPAP